ncbi:MAG TPA: PQQ-binding-like beta-propeller repeat protein, partial [Acidimicrobiales bacterium]|nr:PQQ-binding-like beta-propeller repeat protein [Acidimicrobiales bacterium]
PALAQPSKMGFLFILDRDSGRPLLPVEERAVPQGGVEGEWLSPTQPFPTATPALAPNRLEPEEAWGLTPWDRGKCRDLIAGLRRDGIFTPPSLQGSIEYPGNIGGTNWGGVSFDRNRGLIVLNQTNLPFIVQLIPRDEARRVNPASAEHGLTEGGWEYAPMKGTPYVMRRKPLLSPLGMPCVAPPWGTLAAVEASTGKLRWKVPLGTIRDFTPVPIPIKWGTPTLGGPLTTASGLTFIGSTIDSTFRAFDTETGIELWQAHLPAPALATPMTYRARQGGRQFIVIAAGGHGKASQSRLSDAVVAFSLP